MTGLPVVEAERRWQMRLTYRTAGYNQAADAHDTQTRTPSRLVTKKPTGDSASILAESALRICRGSGRQFDPDGYVV